MNAIIFAAKRTKRPPRVLVDPRAAVIDSEVVKTTRVGGPQWGYDGAKRLAGWCCGPLLPHNPASNGQSQKRNL